MSSNPHNLTLSSNYSRMYSEISKISTPIGAPLPSNSSNTGNILIKNKHNGQGSFLTREDLDLDSPKRSNTKPSSSSSSHLSDSDSSSSSNRRKRSSSSSSGS